MIITEDEALLILILISYRLGSGGISVVDDPVAEGLGEVKLARRIAKEFPDLQSHADIALRGG